MLCLSRPAAACGGGGVTTTSVDTSGVVANSQLIFMSVHAATTDVIVQIGVPATTADYGVLIPVPAEPTLDANPVGGSDLLTLDNATAPTIRRTDVQFDEGGGSSGCGCLGAGSANDFAGAPPPASSSSVAVSAPVNIGPVQAVVLTAANADAVDTWLTDNGFVISDANRPTLEAYAGPGNYFIAIRRSDTATTGAPSSIGIHYTLAGDHRKLSLGFARLGAAPNVAFTLFLATTEAVAPSPPFATLSLYDLDATRLRNGDYAGAVQAAVTDHASQAFVLEAAINKGKLPHQHLGVYHRVDRCGGGRHALEHHRRGASPQRRRGLRHSLHGGGHRRAHGPQPEALASLRGYRLLRRARFGRCLSPEAAKAR